MTGRLRSWWATAPLDRLEGVLGRAYRRWLGHIVWAVSTLGSLALALPGSPRYTLPAVVFGSLVGLRAGKPWRDRLHEKLDQAAALIAQWNASEARDALAEAIPPERPDRGAACSRYGSDATWIACDSCEGWGWHEQVSGDDVEEIDCYTCQGTGGWLMCSQPDGWCQAHPLPGREDVARGNVEERGSRPAGPVAPYSPEAEEPLCAWCPDPTRADCRIDLPTATNVPACFRHRDLARIGDVAMADAVPDNQTVRTSYGERIG